MTDTRTSPWRRARTELLRILAMMALATALLMGTTPLAMAAGEPALAPWGMWTALSLYGAAFVQVLRRLLFPYVDMRRVFIVAIASGGNGAGLVWLGVCIVLAALLLTLGSAARAQQIPAGAMRHLPTLAHEIATQWPDAPDWGLFAGQVEQETCIRLDHPRCWSPRAELRTSRERGVGLGQITRTERFDALAEMRAQFPQLRGWDWESVTLYDPAYQLRAMVLMDRRNFQAITGAGADRMVMALVAYNGGLGGLSSDRKVCQATPGCDPARWWGHVEHTSLKGRRPASGYGRSFFEINREYPVRIMRRAEKYRTLLT